MSNTNPTIELLATRYNPSYTARAEQANINWLGYLGGQKYTDKRLTKFPNESTLDYAGGSKWDGTSVVGRKSYTPSVSYLRPITNTITELVFMQAPIRNGGDAVSLANIDGQDNNIDTIMARANDYLTIFGYAWLKVDAEKTSETLTLAEKQANDIRPFVYAVNPLSVVDWSIGKKKINWVLEEDYIEESASPATPTTTVKVRRLWEPGKCTTIKFLPSSDKRKKQQYSVEVVELSIDEVPWVLLGDIPDSPIAFDTWESLNKHILDLESMNAQIFVDQAFPREFVTEKQLDRLRQTLLSKYTLSTPTNSAITVYNESAVLDQAFQMAVGSKYPQVLGEGESPYTPSMPPGLDAIRKEINECVNQLMQISGISLKNNSNAGQSYLAKIFDAITIRALIKTRAKILENAERLVIYLANAYDPDFPTWEVTYNTELAIEDKEVATA